MCLYRPHDFACDEDELHLSPTMLKTPKQSRPFGLKFDVVAEEDPETEDGKPKVEPKKFDVPEVATHKLSNSLMPYMVSLVDGDPDQEPSENKNDEISTRRAILFKHKTCGCSGVKCKVKCDVDVDPKRIPTIEWKMVDGKSLPRGTASVILFHESTLALMNNHDIAYDVVSHPCAPNEVAIRAVFLCPLGTLFTAVKSDQKCANCDYTSTRWCTCKKVSFCTDMCRFEAVRNGVHSEDDCVKRYAEALSELAAKARLDGQDAADRHDQEEADAEDEDEDADKPAPEAPAPTE